MTTTELIAAARVCWPLIPTSCVPALRALHHTGQITAAREELIAAAERTIARCFPDTTSPLDFCVALEVAAQDWLDDPDHPERAEPHPLAPDPAHLPV
jgi:hypothetical protein